MSDARPRVSTIAPGHSFVDALAAGLLARFPDPEALADVTVLLPTRRACRALQEAFLRVAGGRALLLPSLLPLGDLDAEELLLTGDEGLAEGFDALPPVMPGLTRQLLLTRLILRWGEASAEAAPGAGAGFAVPSFDQALRLAEGLAGFIDQVETEGLEFAELGRIVPEAHAEHWQRTLRFLAIVGETLPALQAELGSVGPAERRRRLHALQLERWRGRAPEGPVIAAGSTGSIPSTAALLHCVAGLPGGEVVLPGLDRSADPEVWARIREEPAHPQHNLARLLERFGLEREQVADWCDPESAEARAPALRAELAELALIPSAAAERWRERIVAIDPRRAREALAGVSRLDLPDSGSEATVVALILRQSLETPGQRAALVTPDRALARRVAAQLGRWGIEIDDSAGRPLAATPPAQFLRLTADLAAEHCAPLALLAALKHPLAAGGRPLGAFRALVRELERTLLRGPRPAAGFAGLRGALDGWLEEALARAGEGAEHRDALRARHARLQAFVAELETAAAPFLAALRAGEAGALLDAHLAFAERLAADESGPGAPRLWAGEAGEALAGFVAELREALAGGIAARIEPGRYPALLDALLAGRAVRPRWNDHPRLAILGPLEARLAHPDVLVLGGLNEGTWPAESDPGPWLSRPMRQEFGLPPLERRIGLAAHDLVQSLGARRVYLTRAERVEGAPSVASRWLLRLEALLEALGLPADLLDDGDHDWAGWAEALDRPEGPPRPLPPPAPKPPLEARPTRLSVTQVETWLRDPYGLYADKILRLRRLEPIDADPGAADRGILIHDSLERFARDFPGALPADPLAALTAIAEQVFAPLAARPAVRAFWWPRFERIARWVVETERSRRPGLAELLAELEGGLEVAGSGFRLTARADRVERRRDGGLVLIDYKTGQPPSAGDMKRGRKPQLPLEAALLARGGFAGLPGALPAGLEVWRLTGGDPAGEIKAIGGDLESLAEAAWAGLERLVASFADPATPYHALPRSGWLPLYSDYRHLARVKEWSAGEEGE